MDSIREKLKEDDNDLTKNLTNDCILRIFCLLDAKTLMKTSEVNKRWNHLSKERIIWKTVNLKPFALDLDEYGFTSLVRTRMKSTKILNLGGITITFKMLRYLSTHCKKLKVLLFGRNCEIEDNPDRRKLKFGFPRSVETLDIRSAIGSFDFLHNVKSTFPKLENFGIGPRSFCRISLTMLFWKLPSLKIVDFTNCLEVDDLTIQVLAQECMSLESLCLIGCRHIYGSTFNYLINHCKSLKTLLLRYLKIEDHVLANNMWKNCVLEELDISACPKITWHGLFPFLVQLKHIKYLNMSYCGDGHAVNDSILSEMANHGITDTLKMLDMRWSFHITSNALASFIPKCKQLENLGIYQSFKITAVDISDLIIHLKHIRIFEFGGSFPQELNQCKLIPNLMATAKNIEVLSLINFTSSTLNEDLKYITEFMNESKQLKRINFCDCSPELVKIGKEAARSMTKNIDITVKWECALPPPKKTLDSLVTFI